MLSLLDQCVKERESRRDTIMDFEDLFKRRLEPIQETIEEEEEEENTDENGKRVGLKIKEGRISKHPSSFGEAYVMFITQLASKGGFQLIPHGCNFCHEHHDEKDHEICVTRQRDNLREKSVSCWLDHCAKERGSRSNTSMQEDDLLKRKIVDIEEEKEEENVEENGKKISVKIKEGRISKHKSSFGEAYVMFITGLASKGGFPLLPH